MPLVPDGYSDLSNPAQTGGKIVLTLTATLTTSFPTTAAFSCGLNATAADVISRPYVLGHNFRHCHEERQYSQLYIDLAVCVGFG